MKSYNEIVSQFKGVIWDKTSDVKCSTGIFTADRIKELWNIPDAAEVYMLVKGQNRTVPFMYGTDLASNYDTEDVVECCKENIKELCEEEYRNNLSDGEEFAPFPSELESEIMIVDQRI